MKGKHVRKRFLETRHERAATSPFWRPRLCRIRSCLTRADELNSGATPAAASASDVCSMGDGVCMWCEGKLVSRAVIPRTEAGSHAARADPGRLPAARPWQNKAG